MLRIALVPVFAWFLLHDGGQLTSYPRHRGHRPHRGARMISAGDDAQVRPPQASVWNIANALTMLRIALVPVFAWFLLHDGGQLTSYRLLAAAVFVVATATDRMDGDIARARGLVTDFGKVSDPIADKTLMGMALIGLSILDLLPWWVTVVVLIRELGVTALRFVVIRHGVIPASRGGKLKTALQAVAILLYILPLGASWHALAVVMMTLAVIVTMLTGIDYVLRAHALRNTSPRAQRVRPQHIVDAGQHGHDDRQRHHHHREGVPGSTERQDVEKDRDRLKGGLELSAATRRYDAVSDDHEPQCSDAKFPDQDHHGDPPRQQIEDREPDERHTHQGLVGDRVAHFAEVGDQTPGPRDIAVHAVGGRRDHEHSRGKQAVARQLTAVVQQEPGEDGHESNAQHGERVGDVPDAGLRRPNLGVIPSGNHPGSAMRSMPSVSRVARQLTAVVQQEPGEDGHESNAQHGERVGDVPDAGLR